METTPYFVFDLDGTLFDTGKDLANSVNASLRTFGLPLHSEDAVISFIGNGSLNLIRKSTASSDEELVAQVHTAFMWHYLEHCLEETAPYPGVLEFLSQPFRASLLTNKPAEPSYRILDHYGLRNRFEIILCGDTAPARKPSPLGLLQILASVGVKHSEAYMVGDDPIDIRVAKAAGVRSIALCGGFGKKQELLAEDPDFCYQDFSSFAREHSVLC